MNRGRLLGLVGRLSRGGGTVAGGRLVAPGHRRETRHAQAFAWLGTAILVLAAVVFAAWIALVQGRQSALEFVAGYTSETSLSIDNLFVFMVAFFSGLPHQPAPPAQGPALGRRRSGCAPRSVISLAGVTLLKRFDWVTWIFGLFLLYCGLFRLVRGGSARQPFRSGFGAAAARQRVVACLSSLPLNSPTCSSPSIPSRRSQHLPQPFVVYTSNIAAVLGLRSVYFALSAMLDRFRYLHYGLGALLAFVALKMLTPAGSRFQSQFRSHHRRNPGSLRRGVLDRAGRKTENRWTVNSGQ